MTSTNAGRNRPPDGSAPASWNYAPVGLFLLLSLSIAGCGHTKVSKPIAPVDASNNNNADATEGGPAAKTDVVAVMSGGQSRIVVVHVPGSLRGPAALVFNLHGSGSTAVDQEMTSGMDETADGSGFIVAYPQGAIPLGSGFAWNVTGQPLSGGEPVPPNAANDSVFIGEAIATLSGKYPIDAKRVYATGMSGGGRMTSQLGCDLSTVLAAVGPVAGLRFPAPCNSARAVPIVAFHGTADAVNPYDGGGPPYWTYGVTSAAEQWAAHDGCGSVPTSSQPEPGVQLSDYTGCAPGAAVQLYSVEGAGHEWPGGPQQSNAIDASAVMWKFFLAHPLP